MCIDMNGNHTSVVNHNEARYEELTQLMAKYYGMFTYRLSPVVNINITIIVEHLCGKNKCS